MNFHDAFPMARMLLMPDTQARCSRYDLPAVAATMARYADGGTVMYREPTTAGVALVVRLPFDELVAVAIMPDGTVNASRRHCETSLWTPSIARKWAHDALKG